MVMPATFDPKERAILEALAAEASSKRVVVTSGVKGGKDYPPLDMVAEFKSRELYDRPLSNGKHAVTCPWETPEQSHKSSPSSTIIREPDNKGGWGFDCKYGECADRTIGDVIARLGVKAMVGDTANGNARPRGGRVDLLRGDEIPAENITWTWPGRIGKGMLTNVVGLPGEGKSLVMCDLAARETVGAPYPPAPATPGVTTPGLCSS